MQGYHWFFLAVVLVIGFFIQKYFDPLSYVGL